MSTTQFLHYRVEAMAKRIAELEAENDFLKHKIKIQDLSETGLRKRIKNFENLTHQNRSEGSRL